MDEGNGGRDALVWDSPITGCKDKLTYAQLQQQVHAAFSRKFKLVLDFFFKINIDKKYAKLRCDFC